MKCWDEDTDHYEVQTEFRFRQNDNYEVQTKLPKVQVKFRESRFDHAQVKRRRTEIKRIVYFRFEKVESTLQDRKLRGPENILSVIRQ